MKAFAGQYFWWIVGACSLVAVLILLSTTSEVSHQVGEKKQEIKQKEKLIATEQQKVAVYADSIKAKDQQITRLTQEKQRYALQDSLIHTAVQADIAAGADTGSPAAAKRFLASYRPSLYDTLR